MKTTQISVIVGLCFLSCTFLGCGSAREGAELCPVSGQVLFKGEPVEGATVAFRSDDAPRMATGTTDANGQFELSTYEPGDGTVPGTHQVTVSKVRRGTSDDEEVSMEDAAAKPPAGRMKQESLLPKKYANPAKPLLEFTVTEGGSNDFTIELEP